MRSTIKTIVFCLNKITCQVSTKSILRLLIFHKKYITFSNIHNVSRFIGSLFWYIIVKLYFRLNILLFVYCFHLWTSEKVHHQKVLMTLVVKINITVYSYIRILNICLLNLIIIHKTSLFQHNRYISTIFFSVCTIVAK